MFYVALLSSSFSYCDLRSKLSGASLDHGEHLDNCAIYSTKCSAVTDAFIKFDWFIEEFTPGNATSPFSPIELSRGRDRLEGGGVANVGSVAGSQTTLAYRKCSP